MAKNRHQKNDSDSEGSIIDSVTNGTSKMKIKGKANGGSKLPIIRDIQVVNPDTFEPKKLKLDDEEESGGISRVGLIYKHGSGDRNLLLTCPKNVNAFFRCNGVEEETYAKKGGQRTGTGKNVMKLYMDGDNPEHEKFYDCLLAICAATKKKIEKEEKKEVDVKIRGLYNVVDDNKNVTGHALAARLIESADGVVYTAAYNDEKQVDVKSVGRCVVRPALSFSYTIPEDGENYRVSVSVAQVLVVTKSLFPLRDLE
ncbi:hypothetical protein BGZ90_008259 [Linnemannia elongata]|nr:hypothetical protein BGZ90_008259 [Linnemannia elongata]